MKKSFHLLPAILLFIFIAGSCSNRESQINLVPDDNNGGLTLPEGFSAIVVAEKLGNGRHIVIKDNGDIYLALRELHDGKGIVALRDSDKNGRAEVKEYFWNKTTSGIDIEKNFLYFSNSTDVYRIPLSAGKLVPEGEPEVIATGFPVQDQHDDKTFALDGSGSIYVNVGAPSNSCQEKDRTLESPGIDPCPLLDLHAGIWKFRSDVAGQTQTQGYRYASGIRNAVAITWNHLNNKLYVVQHGRDQLFQNFPKLYNEQQGAELPSEEFLMVEDGDFFGWPYCYYDHLLKMKVQAPDYGGDGKTAGRCSEAKDPIMAFPGHMAPNDLLFYTGSMFPEKYRQGAFIAFHGSWNRAPLPQKGFFVAFVPLSNGLPSGEWEIFADGFAGVSEVKSTNDAVYRPVGLAQGPDGSIYVSDSNEGRIWRILYDQGK